MNVHSVYAVSRDKWWLTALEATASDQVHVRTLYCAQEMPACLASLPRADPEGWLLIDGTLEGDIPSLVHLARSMGWRHVVPVVALPHYSDARRALQAGADDYWTKTYDRSRMLERLPC